MSVPARFAPRLARLHAEMDAVAADAVLIDHAELLAWASGYTVSQTLWRALIVPRRGDPRFVLRSIDAGPCRAGVWFPGVVAFDDHEEPEAVVARELADLGLADARIAWDPTSYGLTVDTSERLRTLLPKATFVPLPGLSDRLRVVKSADEIAIVERAAAIADRTMLGLEAATAAGLRVRDVAAIAAASLLRLGADDGGPGPILVSSGDIDFLHGHGLDRVLAAGDVLHVELTPRVETYGARLMRPIVVGTPSPERTLLFDRLVALQDAQIAAMRPGAAAREIDAMLRDAVLAEGLRPAYGTVTGYTMGLYGRTPRPSDFSFAFHPGADFRLASGMIFHMYTSAGGIAVSETVLVGDDGPRRLTRCPRRIFVAE
jgi:Xaa-Pro dipeptidase